jgi:hypothetical protein
MCSEMPRPDDSLQFLVEMRDLMSTSQLALYCCDQANGWMIRGSVLAGARGSILQIIQTSSGNHRITEPHI